MPDPAPSQTADVDTDRDSILADLAGSRAASEPKVEPAKDPPEEAKVDPDEDDAPAPEPDKPAVVEKPPAKDPAEDKRQAAIARQERQQKQAAQAEWKKIEAARAEIDKERAELAELKELRKRAKYDPVGYLRAGGVDEDALEDAARAAYAASKAGAAKPENREASARALKEREQYDKLSATEKRLADLEAKIEADRNAAANEREAAKYMAGVFKTARASTDAPLLAKLFDKNAEKAEAKLQEIAYSLAQETDEVPDAADVIATYEKMRRAELEELGIDVDEFLKTKTKTQSKTAGEKPTARTLSNDLSTSTQVRRSDAMSEREERDDILREISKMNAATSAA